MNQKFLDREIRYTIALISIDFTKSCEDTKKTLDDLINYEQEWFENLRNIK